MIVYNYFFSHGKLNKLVIFHTTKDLLKSQNSLYRIFKLRFYVRKQGVLETRFGSLESEKIIIRSLGSEKIGSYRSIPGT